MARHSSGPAFLSALVGWWMFAASAQAQCTIPFAPCDDGNPCTVGEHCNLSLECTGALPLVCIDLNPCTVDTCEPDHGGCVFTPIVCPDDGNPCTNDQCQLGSCVQTPALGAPCDDGNACNIGELCNGNGECGGGVPIFCVDLDPCTTDTCDPTQGCHFDPIQCPDDGNFCTSDLCVLGTCGQPLTGVSCDDGNPCTFDDRCLAGTCGVAPACSKDSDCDLQNNFSCAFGRCVSCADDNPCTRDFCSEDLHECRHLPMDCDDGNPCTSDSCNTETLPPIGCISVGNPGMACDDGNPCNGADVCDPTGFRCGPAPLHNACEVDDDCLTSETCINNRCASCGIHDACTVVLCPEDKHCAFQAIDCEDGNVCTSDMCDPIDGCVYTAEPGPCDDGNPCTETDVCDTSGECHGSAIPDCITPTATATPPPTATDLPTAPPTPTAPETPTATACITLAPAEVTFETSILPTQPRVGDVVQVRVDFRYPPERVVRSEQVVLDDFSPSLRVETTGGGGTSGVSFTSSYGLRALAGGSASLTLTASYEIDSGCVDQPGFTTQSAELMFELTIGPGSTCVGDCSNDEMVTVDELLVMVNIALGESIPQHCIAGDGNQDQAITVDEILTAVNNALLGCPTRGG